MQDHIDILRRTFRWNVDEVKAKPVSFQLDCNWPLESAVTVSSYDRDGRPERLDCLENGGRTNVTEMPDLIRVRGHGLEFGRKLIVGVGQDKNAKRRRHFGFSHNGHFLAATLVGRRRSAWAQKAYKDGDRGVD